MHFRIRGNNVQLVKSVKDKETGKARGETVGSINLKSPEIGTDVRKALTADEIAEVEAWLAARNRIQSIEIEYAAATLADTLAKVMEWTKTASEADRHAVLGPARRDIARLFRILKQSPEAVD